MIKHSVIQQLFSAITLYLEQAPVVYVERS